MPVALLAAAAGKKLVIGKDNDLPWHYSADLKFFKELTMGQPVLMGRVTYDSILKRLGKPLPGRPNIVLTRDKYYQDSRVTAIHDLNNLHELAKPNETLFIIGGDRVFKQSMDKADLLYLTYIDKEYEGDAFFPAIDPAKWEITAENRVEEKGVSLYFRTYKAKKA